MRFEVVAPRARETPVVVEVPHAGLELDAEALATLVVPARSLGRDADLWVDRLYERAPDVGAHLLVARASRYVLDLNRAEDDLDGRVVEGGGRARSPHGLVWHTSTEDVVALSQPLPRRELERRLVALYRPYHAALRSLLEAKRERFGFALLLAAHSMPSRGRAGHGDPGRDRADVVPGSRGGTTAAPEVLDVVADLARERGWSVRHDDPYRGGFTTGHWGRPAEGFHALQVELARRLYMDEATLAPGPEGFEATRDFCTELVGRLGALPLSGAALPPADRPI